MDAIKLTGAEIQSGSNRQRWAEGLIRQLPATHDGRNSWLLNYGVGDEAQALRAKRGIAFNPEYQAAQTIPKQMQVSCKVCGETVAGPADDIGRLQAIHYAIEHQS